MMLSAWISTILAVAAPASVSVTDASGAPLADAVLVRFEQNFTPPAAPQQFQMQQKNHQFSPLLLVIQQGDKIDFPNNDAVRHHVYSFSSPRPFEFQLYSTGESRTMDFPEQGLVVVGCNIHDQMVGYILIGADTYAVSDANGALSLPANYTADGSWHVWHRWMLEQGMQPQPVTYTHEALQTGSFQVNVRQPAPTTDSELDSRFRRRTLNRGN
ncbi:methylamine utilization protein [Aliidiomarina maris]|uniref:Methylamine utilization protein n=1 Tax=Aliidiomarina maris TaxID=531312 RepID=A0A327X1L4_9GAMM|nr:methylamine utilization protein [Aliidiomarina maris]RAJ98445.1 plastocyanin [Aliidiomarina maris]RUO24741.1 methylamine utilization protein [Aliidiomarina maris]